MNNIMVLKDHSGFKYMCINRFRGQSKDKMFHLQNVSMHSREWCRSCETYAGWRGQRKFMDNI